MKTHTGKIKKDILPILHHYENKKAAIFGSYARGENTEASDIDILVEFNGEKSLMDLAGLKIALEELLKMKVDLLTYKSLNPLLRDRILSEQVVIL